MASSSDVVKKIMRFKLLLKTTEEAAKVQKILKKLRNLEITLDILAETGIGKTVNSLRRHELAGELAKSLVRDWKKLVPKQSKSPTTDDSGTLSCKDKLDDQVYAHNGAGDDLNNNCLADEGEEEEFPMKKIKTDDHDLCKDEINLNQDENEDTDLKMKQTSANGILNKRKVRGEEKKKKKIDQYHKKSDGHMSEDTRVKKSKPDHRGKRKRFSDNGNDLSDTDSDKKPSKESKFKGHFCPEFSKIFNEQSSGVLRHSDTSTGKPSSHKYDINKHQNKMAKKEDKVTEEPAMSFESYLSYDANVSKRKEQPKPKKGPKKFKPLLKETPAKVLSLQPPEPLKFPMMSINVRSPIKSTWESEKNMSPPLSPWFSEGGYSSSLKRKDEKETDSCDILEESAIFTGQRLNKKMQVYSGAKTIFLPAMMSLYQQCIRTLQNNINLLYETGGVPFEILEPVLERCTPEQLLRIEEYNPIYIGVTDHLWGKHCQRDFKDSKLQEYESWKEMYLRRSEERERKFQMLTKSIISAQSNKPKGRQVKMAFIHSVAKPPRDVRIKQEIHGTAVQQPPQLKCSVKIQDSRPRQTSKELCRSSSTTSGTSNSQDPRKKTRVAPMMAKSLKAFKNQFGRR